MEFAERLRHLRERAGLNQNAFAREADVPQPVVSRLELGIRGVEGLTVGVAQKLARALGVSVDHLIGMYEDGRDTRRPRASRRKKPREPALPEEAAPHTPPRLTPQEVRQLIASVQQHRLTPQEVRQLIAGVQQHRLTPQEVRQLIASVQQRQLTHEQQELVEELLDSLADERQQLVEERQQKLVDERQQQLVDEWQQQQMDEWQQLPADERQQLVDERQRRLSEQQRRIYEQQQTEEWQQQRMEEGERWWRRYIRQQRLYEHQRLHEQQKTEELVQLLEEWQQSLGEKRQQQQREEGRKAPRQMQSLPRRGVSPALTAQAIVEAMGRDYAERLGHELTARAQASPAPQVAAPAGTEKNEESEHMAASVV
jgi:transcriptional regulator with XRE-family HTH domain